MRICTSCNQELPIEQFSFKNKAKGTRRTVCRSCHSKYVNAWYRQNSASQKAATKRWKAANKAKVVAAQYSVSIDEAERLLSVDACEICGGTEDLHIDHDHTTGQVRGRLCKFCNWGLGSFMDNVDNLAQAVAYLNKTR